MKESIPKGLQFRLDMIKKDNKKMETGGMIISERL